MRRALAALGAVALLALGGPPPAAATFHLIKVREVYPGSAAAPTAEYVELQMYAPAQNFVKGHYIDFLDTAGGRVARARFEADLPNGGNQSTLLVATPEAESQFGIVADAPMPGGSIGPAGGAVCWEALDCVAWGGFHSSTPSPSGSPADPGGIPDGMGLRRSIAPSCPTLFEALDDTNGSAADLFDAFPAPRPNSVTPSERACALSSPGDEKGGTGEGGARTAKPHRLRLQTRIRRHPRRLTRDRTPTFRFVSNLRRARFLCKLDRRRTRRCRSPFRLHRLRRGRHVFRVAALIPGGAVDRTPAVWTFRVLSRGRWSHVDRRRHRVRRPGEGRR